MSGVSLQYPLKPNELSDDLESFIHVICFNALRYHQHDMTAIVNASQTIEEANKDNIILANFVFGMYHASTPHPGGAHVGGEKKMAHNKDGNPGFTMTKRESPLTVLIADLYKLLKAHYAAINFTDLERYKLSAPTQELPSKLGAYVAREIPLPPATALNVPDSASAQPPSPILVQPPTKLEGRVLDTHNKILEAFTTILATIWLRVQARGGFLEMDKLPDQFLNLGEHVLDFPKAASGSKRKSSESAPDQENESGRPAKMVNSGTDSRLASVHEENE